MKRNAFVAGLLLALSASVYFFASGRGRIGSPGLDIAGTAAERATESAEIQAGAPSARPAPDARVDAPIETLTSRAAPKPGTSTTALFAGRCVDADGKPLAGCHVRLRGFRGNRERMDAYLARHDKVDWKEPAAITTGPDGRFSFEFVPPPPYQFALDVKAKDRVAMQARAFTVEAGERRDYGDVTMHAGATIRGRVVDTTSRPVPRARVALRVVRARGSTARHSPDNFAARTNFNARAEEDGSFEAGPLPFAKLAIAVRQHELRELMTLDVSPESAKTAIELVVKSDDEIEKVTGIIVDDLGEAVANAMVVAMANNKICSAMSKSDGSFALKRTRHAPPGPFHVLARCDDYEEGRTPEKLDWGARDVRILVARGQELALRVTDATTGEPIEDYGVRALTKAKSRWASGRLRNRGTHADGQTTVKGLLPGEALLAVEPKDSRWQRSAIHKLTVTRHSSPRLDIALERSVMGQIRVTRSNGETVKGTRIELVESIYGQDVDMETAIVTLEHLGMQHGENFALRLAAGVTNASGICAVEGPAGRKLALRVLGPGHEALIVQNIVLGSNTDAIEVRVPIGARVRGDLRPLALLQQLREQAGLPPRGAVNKRNAERAPGIQLLRIEGKQLKQYPAQPCRLADDGSFEITGAPPGDWDVYLRSSKGNSGSYSSGGTAVAQVAKLREGETRVLDLQLEGQLRSRVSARVFLDGEPYAKAQLVLRGKLAKDATGRERSSWDTVETDAKGGFVRLLEAGTYRATLRIPNDNGARQLELPAEELLSVVAGRAARANFRVQTGRIVLQLRDSAGKPAPAARLSVRRDVTGSPLELPVAGADGVLRARLPQGSWSLFVMRKELLDPAKGRAFLRMHQADPKVWERMRTLLRRIDVGADESTLRVTLPAAAGY